MKRVLVTGVTGQVGSALAELYNNDASVELIAVDRAQLDLTDERAVYDAVRNAGADVVINPAAYTAVDKAESEKAIAQAINAQAPGAMARACQSTGSLLVHFSTDYVFNGEGTEPYREDDPTDPLGVYGHTKLQGELAIAEYHDRYLVLRTSWVYSHMGNNFVNTMLRLAADRDSLSVVNDQHGSPTYAPDLAAASATLVNACEDDATAMANTGIYHLCGTNHTTWFEFARTIFAHANLSVDVAGIPATQYPTPAPRPRWSVMDTSKAKSTFDVALPQWPDALRRCLTKRTETSTA